MINKDENNDINKDEPIDPIDNQGNPDSEELNSENPIDKKRGRPKKIKEEITSEEIKESTNEHVQENTEPKEEVTEEGVIPAEEVIPESEAQTEIKEETGKEIADEVKEEQTEKETEEIKLITSTEKINKQSNYQISLLDENHLRAKVLTNKLVAVLCSVKDKYTTEQNSGERQTNKIFVHPKEKPQEVEIMLSVGSAPVPGENNTETAAASTEFKAEKESNYQISLVDENLLRVFVVTEKSVSIDCLVKDEVVQADGSNETQANRIFIHPKDKFQEVEIIISIGSAALTKQTETLTGVSEKHTSEEKLHKTKLTPNPLVANLIQKFSDAKPETESTALTPEEKLEEKLGPKNPWRLYKELMHRNLLVGLAGAVMVYLISVISFYSIASKKNNNADVIEAPRLIVMQDLPENQFQQNVEDPNKPKEEIKESEDGANTNKIPPIIPKKIKPPRITGPTKTKTDTSTALNKELDSLRKVNANITNNGKNPTDTSKRNITSGNNPIPDSIMRGLKDNEVGLIGKFPPNWKQIDSREVDINKKEFTGVILVDTAVKKKEESLNMSVQIDKNNEYWKQFNFKNVFQEDSLKNVIYSIDPKQEGDQTYYRFYISGMAYNIYIAAFINNEHFEKHKAEVEQVVRTIRIQKPGTTPGK